jgi:hypothetical protein
MAVALRLLCLASCKENDVRYTKIKTLGLAAVATMALMAFLGAGSASATVLCKTAETVGCSASGWDYPAGTNLVATSTNLTITSSTEPVTCKHSVFEGKTENTGSATATVTSEGEVSVSFKECNHRFDTIKGGTLEIHHSPEKSAAVTSKNMSVTTSIFGISCVYGTPASGLKIGDYTNASGIIDVSATVEKKEGGFLCPGSPLWEGTYTVTSPSPVYISAS